MTGSPGCGGGDPAVGSVGLQLAGLDVVGKDDGQDAVEQTARLKLVDLRSGT